MEGCVGCSFLDGLGCTGQPERNCLGCRNPDNVEGSAGGSVGGFIGGLGRLGKVPFVGIDVVLSLGGWVLVGVGGCMFESCWFLPLVSLGLIGRTLL